MIIKSLPDEIQNYLVDASNFKGHCEGVYLPSDENEIIEIIKDANSKKKRVTISGNGTGLAGGRVPQGGIVISMEKLNKILEINTDGKFAVIEPGVILKEFQDKVREKNLLYPPDPTESNCFIGGTIATNASGEKTFKYGSTRVYVNKLEIILADGDKLKLERGKFLAEGYTLNFKTESGKEYKLEIPVINMPLTKNTAGYFCKENMDGIDLFIGSEGTLGVITKAELKLVPYPENIISCIIFFNEEKNALHFIREARDLSYQNRKDNLKQAIDALTLEFFDENSLNFLKDEHKKIPSFSKAAVWFEQEVNASNEEWLFEEWMKLVKANNGGEENAWFAMNEKEKKDLEEFRYEIALKVTDFLAQYNVNKLGTDMAVPNERFNEFYYFCTEEMKKNKFNYVAYGHFGNSHLHMNLLPRNKDEYEKGKVVYKNIYRKVVELGGTVSAEHGIGKIKRDYLLEMYGEKVLREMANIKKQLDPNFILGYGNIFKEEFLK
jgi:D-lactate dehydrogenase (cytochrome)